MKFGVRPLSIAASQPIYIQVKPIEIDPPRIANNATTPPAPTVTTKVAARPRPRWLVISGGVLAGLLTFFAIVALIIFLLGWNWMRGPISTWVSTKSGRSFAINGNLDIAPLLSLQPRLIANDVVFGNADWSREPNMAEVSRVEITIDLGKLLRGTLDVPMLVLSKPRIVLETNPAVTIPPSAPNWIFNTRTATTTTTPTFPHIGALRIDEGSVIYRDPSKKTDLMLSVKTLTNRVDQPEEQLSVVGKGKFNGLPTSIEAEGGALLSLRTAQNPYPIRAKAIIGATKASINGALMDPLRLAGVQLNFKIEGSDLAQLYPLIGVPFPPTPAYRLAGFLDHTNMVWKFRDFNGIVGESDLAGVIEVDRTPTPQKITATLTSQKLLMADLGGFIGAKRGIDSTSSMGNTSNTDGKGSTRPIDTPKNTPPTNKLLPTEPFSLEKHGGAPRPHDFRHGRHGRTGP